MSIATTGADAMTYVEAFSEGPNRIDSSSTQRLLCRIPMIFGIVQEAIMPVYSSAWEGSHSLRSLGHLTRTSLRITGNVGVVVDGGYEELTARDLVT